MSDLGKLIGGMMTGLALARRNADVTARNIALEYQKDPLLQVFPVPRIDFQNVSAELPLILMEVVQPEEPPVDTTPPMIDLVQLRADCDGIAIEMVNQALQLWGLPIEQLPVDAPPAARTTSKRRSALRMPTPTPTPTREQIDQMIQLYSDSLFAYGQKVAERQADLMPTRNLISPSHASPQIMVGATATDLEKAPPLALGRVQFDVGVQNYQWVEVDRDAAGKPVYKLTPAGR